MFCKRPKRGRGASRGSISFEKKKRVRRRGKKGNEDGLQKGTFLKEKVARGKLLGTETKGGNIKLRKRAIVFFVIAYLVENSPPTWKICAPQARG